MESLTAVLGNIANALWSLPLVLLLLGTGLFFTVRLFVPQIRKMGHGFAIIAGKYDNPNDAGDVSHFQALCAALSATVGVGNIAGVATAIHAGGPGALFWMWVSAFFGMMTKYSECLLSLKYRTVHKDGTVSGGPMYYIERGLGPKFKWLAIAFAFCAMMGTFGGGNMVQSNSMAIAVIDCFVQKYKNDTSMDVFNGGQGINQVNGTEFRVLSKDGSFFDVELFGVERVEDFINVINNHPGNKNRNIVAKISSNEKKIEIADHSSGSKDFYMVNTHNSKVLDELGFLNKHGKLNKGSESVISTIAPEMLMFRAIIGVTIAFIVGIVIVGGMRRIGMVAGKVVPIMSGLYVGGGLIILFLHFDAIPHAFYLIFKHAFTPTAATGGFAGATVLYTITWGIKRAAFSNEAGMGSAPIAHAAARTHEPVREGLVAMAEPLIDTITICTITGLVIIVTGAWQMGDNSSVLTMKAFSKGLFGYGGFIVTIGLILFSISTAISWSYYGDRCAEYLFGPRAIFPYRCVFVAALCVGAITKLAFVWNFSDIVFGLMFIPNLIGILGLSGVVVAQTKEYFSRKHVRHSDEWFIKK